MAAALNKQGSREVRIDGLPSSKTETRHGSAEGLGSVTP
jgi:hypothetical protein